jgi:hypothetical protein
MSRATGLAIGWMLASALTARAGVAAAEEPKERFFYHGYDYGTQAIYNPFWVFINGGYDVLQIRGGRRNIFNEPYGVNLSNTADNVFVHPFRSVSEEGWARFMKQEILPLSFTNTTARWVPNYSLHLLGGGMTYRAMWEWYDAQGLPVPYLLSAATFLSYGFLNEAVENKGIVGRNTDGIADFWVFDMVGIALFSFRSVSRFFSKTIIVSDWSLQPTMTFPGYDLHNHGQYFAGKWPLPFYPRVRLFAWAGMAQLGGLSIKLDSEYSISAAGGVMSTRFVNSASGSVRNTVDFVPSGALFIDRKESLLALLQMSDVQDYFLHLNVYPNAFWKTRPGLGFWGVTDRQGHFIMGVCLAPLGIGAGYGSF